MNTHLHVITTEPEPAPKKSFRYYIHCARRGCSWKGWAGTDWQAYHLLGEHLIQQHVKPNWTRREN